jgi:hypothetical protein
MKHDRHDAHRSPAKHASRGLRLPPEAVEAFAMGLALYDRGYGGAGLVPATIREARDAERTGRVSEDKARRMAAWFARHGASPAENAARRRDRSSPASVAWLLWGGDAGRAWASTKAARRRNPRPNPSGPVRRHRGPLDAIFWHGSSGDEDTWRWYTASRQHAAYFGPVTKWHITDPEAVFLDAETDEALRGLQGADADAALLCLWREEGRRTLVVRGWEGGRDNLTVYLGDSGESEPA